MITILNARAAPWDREMILMLCHGPYEERNLHLALSGEAVNYQTDTPREDQLVHCLPNPST
jgi:hypothetical protein